MAEENIDSYITPERNGLDREISRKDSSRKAASYNGDNTRSYNRRASMGSYHARANSSRSSTEIANSPNISQLAVPHYLRASTGSCHDLCKYGRKHAFEATGMVPLMKRMTKPQSKEQNPEEMKVAAEQKKEMVVRHKLSRDVQIYSAEPRHSSDTKSYSLEGKPILEAEIHSANKKTSSGIKKGMLKHKRPSPTTKTSSPDPPEIIKHEISLPSKKVEVAPKRDTLTDYKMLRNEKKTNNTLKKNSHSVLLKPVLVKQLSSVSDTSHGMHGKGCKSSDIKAGRKTIAPKLSEEKVLTPPKASLSPRISLSRIITSKARRARSLKLVSPLKDQIRMCKAETGISNSEVPEKTLHVIKAEIKNNLLESVPYVQAIPSLPSPSSPKSLSHEKSPTLMSCEEEEEEAEYADSDADDFVSDYDAAAKTSKIETVEDDHSKALRKSGRVISEDKDGSSVKLKFRRGKVVDLQSDNSSPRRLRFRRGRVLGEDQNGKGDLKRRIFRKGGLNDDKTGTGPSPRKVVLKHQDPQGKKDAQGLFNNVIEETASKLVESRKSKVKALVGAFETVISLQESKPSSNTVA